MGFPRAVGSYRTVNKCSRIFPASPRNGAGLGGSFQSGCRVVERTLCVTFETEINTLPDIVSNRNVRVHVHVRWPFFL